MRYALTPKVSGLPWRDQRIIRYEVFSEIDLSGLLHYMVTFNTGQRRMSLAVQLEIMRQPLIEELEKQAQIPVWHEMGYPLKAGHPLTAMAECTLASAPARLRQGRDVGERCCTEMRP